MSSDAAPDPAEATVPGWLPELLDVLHARRRVLVLSASALSVVGVLAAVLLPGFVPPRPLVGAAVGIAAALLSVAVAVATDSADPIVRGIRHVRAAGGEVVAAVPPTATPQAAAELAARIDAQAGAGGRHWVALAPVSRSRGDVSAWADALGVALSQRRRRVVVIDLADGPTPGRPGVVEVVHDELQLGEAVDFDRELLLARLGAGADDVAALEMLTGLVPRLPSDIELLVVALPPLGQPGALAAAGSLDRVLVLAESGRTPRVDLIASLDAIDATATASAVVLIDPSAGSVDDDPAAPPAAELTAPLVAEPVVEPVAESVVEPTVEPTVEPVVEPVVEPAREAIAEPVAPPAAEQAAPVVEANTQPIPRVEPARDHTDADPGPDPGPDIDGDAQAGELDDDGSSDPVSEPGRWATPPGHATVTGAALDAPSHHDEDSAETLRVAAALQTLAQEVWTRDDA